MFGREVIFGLPDRFVISGQGLTLSGPWAWAQTVTAFLEDHMGRMILAASSRASQAPGLAPGFYHLSVECDGALLGSQRIMHE